MVLYIKICEESEIKQFLAILSKRSIFHTHVAIIDLFTMLSNQFSTWILAPQNLFLPPDHLYLIQLPLNHRTNQILLR